DHVEPYHLAKQIAHRLGLALLDVLASDHRHALRNVGKPGAGSGRRDDDGIESRGSRFQLLARRRLGCRVRGEALGLNDDDADRDRNPKRIAQRHAVPARVAATVATEIEIPHLRSPLPASLRPRAKRSPEIWKPGADPVVRMVEPRREAPGRSTIAF